MAEHRHLRRLDRIWIPRALYFLTVCTHGRHPILASPKAADILQREWAAAKKRHGWLIGRYVVMPDHVHFFCAEKADGSIRLLFIEDVRKRIRLLFLEIVEKALASQLHPFAIRYLTGYYGFRVLDCPFRR